MKQNQYKEENIGAIILAGGKSRRFGSDKALYKFKGLPLIQNVINVVNKVTKNIIIITNSPEKFDFLIYPKYRDLIPDCGSLGGIYTGLSYTGSQLNFVLACDMPFISYECLNYLVQHTTGTDITVPYHHNRLEPLCAVYSKSCLPFIKKQLEKKEYQIFQFYDKVRTKKIEIPFYHPRLFFNVNSRNDLLSLY